MRRGRISAIGFALGLLVAIPVSALADLPGKHPAYNHALADLRLAHNMLNRPEEANVTDDERHARKEIDEAYKELKRAAFFDGKEIDSETPPDAHWDRRHRLQEAMEALHKAHEDVSHEEDNVFVGGLRKRALEHIDRAKLGVEAAIADKRFDRSVGQ